jgi:NTE family protein
MMLRTWSRKDCASLSSRARAALQMRQDSPLSARCRASGTGRLELLGPDSGISIETATAASGAVPGIWPSVPFNGHEWIDAGMVSAANAMLAAGHDRIVVLAPMYEGHAGIPSAQDDVDRLNQDVRAYLAIPDEDSREAIGPNLYDPHRAQAAAEAGRRQGRALASGIKALWA